MQLKKLLGASVLGFAGWFHASAGAQALPAPEMDAADMPQVRAAAPASPASAATFGQLSTPPAATLALPDNTPPAQRHEPGPWLLLAGMASLLFITRRYRRHQRAEAPAAHGAPH